MLNPHFPWLNPHEFGFTVLSKGPPAIPSRLMGSWAMAEAKALLRLETAESMRPKALGVSINGGTPKNGGWFIVGNPIKMDDLGVPYFRKPPYIYIHIYICVCMYMYVYIYMCVYIYICMYIYIYIYVCMYVCVCVRVKLKNKHHCTYVYMYMCIYVYTGIYWSVIFMFIDSHTSGIYDGYL